MHKVYQVEWIKDTTISKHPEILLTLASAWKVPPIEGALERNIIECVVMPKRVVVNEQIAR